MNKLLTLTRLELLGLYGINQFRHTRDPKVRNRYRLLGTVWAILIGLVVFYVGGLVYGLCLLGLGEIAPAYLAMLASLLILAFGLFLAGPAIFGRRGYDFLRALPLKPTAIVLSRFLSLYVQDLLMTVLIMLPGCAVYGFCQRPGAGFYLTALVGTPLIPAIPLVISLLLGTVIMALSAGMKHKSLVQTGLSIALVVGILVGSFQMGGAEDQLTPEMLASMAQTLADLIGKLYPPALWLGTAMTGKNSGGLGLFCLASLGCMGLCTALTAWFFPGIMDKLGAVSARNSYKLRALECRSLRKTLYVREVKRYFSSSIYVTNTILGPIMGAIGAGALCFGGLDTLEGSLPFDFRGLIPLAIGAVFCMMTTTSISLSMEGRQLWIFQSLPIPMGVLLDAKVLLNLSLMAPFYVLAEAFLIIALKPGFWELMWLMLLPMGLCLFSAVLGIAVDLKLRNFSWEKEEQVVKQSASAALGGFAGLLLGALLAAGVYLTPSTLENPVKAGICILLFGAAALLRSRNNRASPEQL